MNNIVFYNTGLEAIASGLLAAFIAQFLKVVIYLCTHKKINFKIFTTTGGMPSSHSATVCALATAACIQYGAASFEFAISLILALIVMYDAMGVRREAGIQAKMINEMIEMFAEMGKDNLSPDEKLKEFVGHTPLQVMAGAILGILIAFAICGIFAL